MDDSAEVTPDELSSEDESVVVSPEESVGSEPEESEVVVDSVGADEVGAELVGAELDGSDDELISSDDVYSSL